MRGLRAEGPRQRRAHVGKMRTTYTSKSKQQRKGGGREGRREGGDCGLLLMGGKEGGREEGDEWAFSLFAGVKEEEED